jgi:hypothetical protein
LAVSVGEPTDTVERDTDTPPEVKVTEAVGVIGTPSVVSVAVNVAVSAVVVETRNFTVPVALEGPEAAPIVTFVGLETRLTVFPETGFPSPSVNVTVMVLVDVPLATTLVGLAATVETVGETTPEAKVIEVVGVRARLSVESVAVSFSTAAVVAVTGNVT